MDRDKIIKQVENFPAEKIAGKIRSKFRVDEDTEGDIEHALSLTQLEARTRLAEIFADLVTGNKLKSSVYRDIRQVARDADKVARAGKNASYFNRSAKGAFVHKGQGGAKSA